MSETTQPQALPPSPPEAWEPMIRVARLARRPLDSFLRIEAASGILLLSAAALALLWANSPWRESYDRFWHLPLGIRLGDFVFERSLAWFVNDVLMAIFFFVVGLEIRRELHHGELSQWRRAVLPLAAALGGMLVPAALYLVFAGGPDVRAGWGIPMATDIAFAIGILTLLGKRVPPALRVLLLALAVIDDLGAILVIALFYSSGISFGGLVVAASGLLAILFMQRLGVRNKVIYLVPSVIAWGGIYAAGIHPTLAGVAVGLLTPVRAWLGLAGFQLGVRQELEHLATLPPAQVSTHALSESLRQIDLATREALSPAESLIEALHPWVAFGIMPVFALANAGVSLSATSLDPSVFAVASGVSVGLLLGKPAGVLLAIWATLRLRLGTLPAGLRFPHLLLLGLVAGIGFTMALFIAQLAFTEASRLSAAKLGVLASSGAAAFLAFLLGRLMLSPQPTADSARSADEAESATRA
ncbi:MAG: Na+/H+ antiporter NhaA [Deltaproteobacteria bacterium]|nr:Na+/H+ antiporter NhaA [Deltaproteobacteria bacterium]